MAQIEIVTSNGQHLSFTSVAEACRWYNISRVTYYRRIAKGQTIKEALEGPAFDYDNLPMRSKKVPRQPTPASQCLKPGEKKQCSRCKEYREILPDVIMKARNHPLNFCQDVDQLEEDKAQQGSTLSLDNKARRMATYEGFHKDKYAVDGYRHICRNCANKKSRGHYHDNRPQCQEQHREWYNASMQDPVYAEQRKEDKKRHREQAKRRKALLNSQEMTDLAWAFTKNSDNFTPREHDPGAPGEHAYNTVEYQPKRAVTQAVNALCASDGDNWEYVYGATTMNPAKMDED